MVHPVRIGLLGLGQMGRNHLRILSMLKGVELAFVHDANPEHAATVAAQYGVVVADDLDAALVNGSQVRCHDGLHKVGGVTQRRVFGTRSRQNGHGGFGHDRAMGGRAD